MGQKKGNSNERYGMVNTKKILKAQRGNDRVPKLTKSNISLIKTTTTNKPLHHQEVSGPSNVRQGLGHCI